MLLPAFAKFRRQVQSRMSGDGNFYAATKSAICNTLGCSHHFIEGIDVQPTQPREVETTFRLSRSNSEIYTMLRTT